MWSFRISAVRLSAYTVSLFPPSPPLSLSLFTQSPPQVNGISHMYAGYGTTENHAVSSPPLPPSILSLPLNILSPPPSILSLPPSLLSQPPSIPPSILSLPPSILSLPLSILSLPPSVLSLSRHWSHSIMPVHTVEIHSSSLSLSLSVSLCR